MTTEAGNYQVKRPDLTREGASLRKAVRGELEWTRTQTKKTAWEAVRKPSKKTASGSDANRKT